MVKRTTAIEWTTQTLNWVTGCTKVSDGCRFCYMYREYPRLRDMGVPSYQWQPSEVHIHESVIEKPLHWKAPRMVFVNSMGDTFHEQVPFAVIDRFVDVMQRTPQYVYQVLTKRSKRLVEYGERIGEFPPNVWLGVTVENAQCKLRIDDLRRIKAKVHFVSFGPLIDAVGKLNLTDIEWAIVEGESGVEHRPIKEEWVKEIFDQCREQGVAFFFKGWGGVRPKDGGRLFMGCEWNEYPASMRKELRPQRQNPIPLKENTSSGVAP